MAAEDCPNCGHYIGTPGMFHGGGTSGMQMHTHRVCPGCDRPLIWFNEGELAGAWRIDEAEERQRRQRND